MEQISTLYERLGGEPAVNAAVEVFYRRVLSDAELAPFFQSVDLRRLRAHQFAFLSQALGGPRQYRGASMSRAHARLAITQRHFDRVATHLVATLRELGVQQEMIEDVCSAIAPLAAEIVNTVEPLPPPGQFEPQQRAESGRATRNRSLRRQRTDRRSRCGLLCRQETRYQRREADQSCRLRQHRRAVPRNMEQHRFDRPPHHPRSAQSNRDTGRQQPQADGEKLPPYLHRPRTERDPNADLPLPLRDRITQYAVHADRDQQDCHPRKQSC